MSTPALTQARLKDLLHYDPVTGIFTRRVGTKGGTLAGAIIDDHSDEGYVRVMLDGRRYKCHRLAWFYVYGQWPKGPIDHKDTLKDHNWITNLREATHTYNRANTNVRRDNISGIKGVYWQEDAQRWRAQITKDGEYYYLGVFLHVDEARRAYRDKAEELFGEFARAV